MEESVNKIIKKLNSDLNLIDTENFLNTIKDFDSQNSYEFCKNFCDEINTVKKNIVSNMTNSLTNLTKMKKKRNISQNKIKRMVVSTYMSTSKQNYNFRRFKFRKKN